MVNLPPPESDDRQPARPTRDNDEAIALAIAFVSIGAILWWGWSRGQNLFAPVFEELPAISGVTSREAAPSGDREAATADESRRFFPFFGDDETAEEAAMDEADTQRRELTDDETTPLRGLGDRSRLRPPTAAVVPPETDTDAFPETAPPVTGTEPVTPEAEIPAAATEAETPAETAEPTPPDETTAETAEPLPALDIADVAEDYWAYPYIVSLFEADLLPDLPTGQLQPDKELTRAELAALLSSSFVGTEQPQRSLAFTDIASDYWAAAAIQQVVAAGYMTGYPDDTFKPNEPVPRYQVLVTMATGLGLTPPGDVAGTLNRFQGAQGLPDWSRSQVAAAADAGIVVNHPDPQQLAPQETATRAELIAIIHQALAAQGRIDPVETPFANPQ